MFPAYFQQELSQLRNLGKEFSEAHPSLAPMLRGPQSDPDVERLLEGTAFLTALMRQKLDDEFPEIIQDLMQIVAPQYLKPLPSATIQVFRPKSTVRQTMKLPAGISCASVPVDGVSCLFRTCYGLEIHPLSLADAVVAQRPGQAPLIKLSFELQGLPLGQWKPESVRLYLADPFSQATDLYQLLRRSVRAIYLVPKEGGKPLVLDRQCLNPVGFGRTERLIPGSSQAFPGFGVLQDYFILPQKFLFLDLVGWDRWTQRGSGTRFEVHFELDPLSPVSLRVSRESFVLHATPAVNLFSHEADPIYLDHQKTACLIRPSGAHSDQTQVFSVDEVKGFAQGTCEERTYRSFDTFRPTVDSDPTFHVSLAPSPIDSRVDPYLSVAYPPDRGLPPAETLSIKLTCTQGSLPGRLRVGDLTIHGKGCPEYLTFTNLLAPTTGAPPPIGKNLLWRLLSHLSAGFQSLEQEEVLKSMLELYLSLDARDPETLANHKRIDSIQAVKATSSDRLVSGMVMRGRDVTVTIRDDHFSSRGDAYLFGCMLDVFFGNYASINSFTSLTLKELNGGSTLTWPPRMGNRPLI